MLLMVAAMAIRNSVNLTAGQIARRDHDHTIRRAGLELPWNELQWLVYFTLFMVMTIMYGVITPMLDKEHNEILFSYLFCGFNALVLLFGVIVSCPAVDEGEEPPELPTLETEKRRAVMTLIYNQVVEMGGVDVFNLASLQMYFGTYKDYNHTDSHRNEVKTKPFPLSSLSRVLRDPGVTC